MSTGFSTHVGPPDIGAITLPVSQLSTLQYLQMIDAGILGPSDKVELIGGLITPMSPAGPEHNSSLIQLTEIFAQIVGRYHLLVQGTVVIAEGHVFEPDIALLRRKAEGYRRALPRAEDVLLVVESAASSLPRDRHVKLPIYAAAGINEYWIADLDRELLSVFRERDGTAYRSEQTLSGNETVAPIAGPDVVVRVADIFA
jgi:Uma2 family endonuclease